MPAICCSFLPFCLSISDLTSALHSPESFLCGPAGAFWWTPWTHLFSQLFFFSLLFYFSCFYRPCFLVAIFCEPVSSHNLSPYRSAVSIPDLSFRSRAVFPLALGFFFLILYVAVLKWSFVFSLFLFTTPTASRAPNYYVACRLNKVRRFLGPSNTLFKKTASPCDKQSLFRV